MPYIKQTRRPALDTAIAPLRALLKDAPVGDLNYAITKLLTPENLDYYEIMTVVGTLECVKLEFYRRAAVPYEDTKARENGDVYSNATPAVCGHVVLHADHKDRPIGQKGRGRCVLVPGHRVPHDCP
jgi:hypothetical protein